MIASSSTADLTLRSMSDIEPHLEEHERQLEEEFERERLHWAVQRGDVEEVKRLVSLGDDPNAFDSSIHMGWTPLHYAVIDGHLEIMQLLLAAGADVNANDESVIGNTPLREVAENCSYEVAKLLIDAGADPTIPGWMQLTAIHVAQERKKPEGVARKRR